MLGRIGVVKNLVGLGLALAMLALVGCNGATQDAPRRLDADGQRGFLTRRLPNGREYAVFVPLKYDARRKYPAIVFLHGLGEGGSDIKKPLSVGLAPYVAKHAENFDFIVIFPQSDNGGWDGDSQSGHDAILALEDTAKVFNVDRDCVTLTGLSTGGHGTWALGAKHGEYFSALAPMCAATGYTENSAALAKMNIWAFENAADPFVMPFATQSSVGAVRSAGGTVRHTVYPLPGHDCWDVAYGDELFGWMKQQRRSGVASAKDEPRSMAAAPIAPAAAPRPAMPSAPSETRTRSIKQTTDATPVRSPAAPLNPTAPVRMAPARDAGQTTVIPPTVY